MLDGTTKLAEEGDEEGVRPLAPRDVWNVYSSVGTARSRRPITPDGGPCSHYEK
jgi:hypothetical protein